jgi:hypothetical protein
LVFPAYFAVFYFANLLLTQSGLKFGHVKTLSPSSDAGDIGGGRMQVFRQPRLRAWQRVGAQRLSYGQPSTNKKALLWQRFEFAHDGSLNQVFDLLDDGGRVKAILGQQFLWFSRTR